MSGTRRWRGGAAVLLLLTLLSWGRPADAKDREPPPSQSREASSCYRPHRKNNNVILSCGLDPAVIEVVSSQYGEGPHAGCFYYPDDCRSEAAVAQEACDGRAAPCFVALEKNVTLPCLRDETLTAIRRYLQVYYKCHYTGVYEPPKDNRKYFIMGLCVGLVLVLLVLILLATLLCRRRERRRKRRHIAREVIELRAEAEGEEKEPRAPLRASATKFYLTRVANEEDIQPLKSPVKKKPANQEFYEYDLASSPAPVSPARRSLSRLDAAPVCRHDSRRSLDSPTRRLLDPSSPRRFVDEWSRDRPIQQAAVRPLAPDEDYSSYPSHHPLLPPSTPQKHCCCPHDDPHNRIPRDHYDRSRDQHDQMTASRDQYNQMATSRDQYDQMAKSRDQYDPSSLPNDVMHHPSMRPTPWRVAEARRLDDVSKRPGWDSDEDSDVFGHVELSPRKNKASLQRSGMTCPDLSPQHRASTLSGATSTGYASLDPSVASSSSSGDRRSRRRHRARSADLLDGRDSPDLKAQLKKQLEDSNPYDSISDLKGKGCGEPLLCPPSPSLPAGADFFTLQEMKLQEFNSRRAPSPPPFVHRSVLATTPTSVVRPSFASVRNTPVGSSRQGEETFESDSGYVRPVPAPRRSLSRPSVSRFAMDD